MRAPIGSVLGAGLVLLASAIVSPARAQPSPHPVPMLPPAQLLDPTGPAARGSVPPGEAVIRGRVVLQGATSGVGEVDVVLYARTAVGDEGIRVSRTDAGGFFSFPGVSSEPSTSYLVGARHEGIPFGAVGVAFQPGETEREVVVEVTERTTDPRDVAVRELRLRLERVGARLALTESYRLENRGSATVYARGSERARVAPPLRATLPAAAERFGSNVAALGEGLEHDDRDVAFWGPVYPGEDEISFDYRLPAGDAESLRIDKPLPTAVERVVVLYPEDGPVVVAGGGLEAGDPVTVGNRTYRSLEAGPRPRGARLSLQVELPPALDDPNALSISQARVFFEHDAAMLRVREEIHLRVEGDAPLVGTNEAPLVQFPIPRGATGLRFGPDTLRMGLEARAGGGLLFLGPIKPGASTVNLGYDLPVPDGTALWERSFGLEIPVLMLLIADTGLVVESDRLHRRRSVRTPDLSYMVAEGFRIGAEETISLGLRPLEARPGVRLSTAGVLVWSVGLLTAGLVLTPLRRREGGSADEAVGAEAALQREREALYASIRDLDHDHEVGKVTESDYLALRAPLRARAVALLRAEREAPQVAAARSVEDEAVAGACPDCGAQRGAADRFCSQCGLRLDANPAVESGTRG